MFLYKTLKFSDQVCEFQKKEISKSKNAQEALAQLKKFNGKIHFQNNAVVIAFGGKIIFENFSRMEAMKATIASSMPSMPTTRNTERPSR
jgi:predicted house-cleaning NTP pyrophosphatase (Maf/HAM1 superfamily)